MIPYELRKLIDLALEDGVLTDKEREIIFARAKAKNEENEDNYVDLDELAIYIDNKLQERQNELKDDGKRAVDKLIDSIGLDAWRSDIKEIAKFDLSAVKNAEALDRLLCYFKELVDARKWGKDKDNDKEFYVAIKSKYAECRNRVQQLYPSDSRFAARMTKEQFNTYILKSRIPKSMVVGCLIAIAIFLGPLLLLLIFS